MRKITGTGKFDAHRIYLSMTHCQFKCSKTYGIKHLLAVDNPDSTLPNRNISEFPAVRDYRLMLEDIKQPCWDCFERTFIKDESTWFLTQFMWIAESGKN